jgi:hypothetical protein
MGLELWSGGGVARDKPWRLSRRNIDLVRTKSG